MARNTPLSSLLLMLKGMIGKSLTVGTADDAILKQLLSDKQKWLSCEYDWPFLEDRFDVNVVPNSRYLAFPTTDQQGHTTTLNLERPVLVETFWNNLWTKLDYGIGSSQFNYLNSDQPGNKQDPIQNWRWSEENQFEIWPINTGPQTVRFTGQRALGVLVAPSDTADLDDLLIVLPVAAELLARSKQQDSQLKQQQFQERLWRLRSSYPTYPKGLTFGRGNEPVDRPRLISIGVHGN